MLAPNRRHFIEAAACSAASLVLAAHGTTALAAATDKILSLPNPPLDDPKAPSFDVFYRLSQLVTCRVDLDRDLARRMFETFAGEPWVEKHISTSYRNLLDAIKAAGPGANVPQLIKDGAVVDGERWFVSHLLTTWYLGVYYHPERDTVRLTYQHALMHKLLGDYRPVPGYSDREVGFWSERPPVKQ